MGGSAPLNMWMKLEEASHRCLVALKELIGLEIVAAESQRSLCVSLFQSAMPKWE
jgi:hypothetical protein